MESTFNVVTKGADPTGTNDSREPIQATIEDAKEAGGGVVFFPPGEYLLSIDPAINRALTLRGNVSLVGHDRGITRLKAVDGAGDYHTLIGFVIGEWLDDVCITGLTVDNNTANNPYDPEGYDIPPAEKGRASIIMGKGRRIAITDCRFTNIEGTSTIMVSGGVSDVSILRNCFDEIGGTCDDHDYSAIFLQAWHEPGNGVWIQDNSIRAGAPGKTGARSGIETHGSGYFVSGNFVQDMDVGILISGVCDRSEGQIVRGNQIVGAQMGMSLYSFQYKDYTNEIGLQDCLITDNLITLDIDAWAWKNPFARGIETLGRNDLPIHNLVIDGNVIRFLPHETLTTNSHGIAMWDAVAHENWRIADNLIIDSPNGDLWFNRMPANVVLSHVGDW